MHRSRGALAVLATVFLSLLAAGFAGSAVAGGPTSVLLVVPGEGRTASLYTGSADYIQLTNLVGGFETPTGSTTPPEGASDNGPSGTDDASGPGVTLTWLMHDVSVWRIDRVYLKAKGGPWISTQMSMGGGDLWVEPAIWHQAAGNGKALTVLLDRLGVGNAGSGSGPSDPVLGEQGTDAEQQNPTAPTAAPEAEASGTSDSGASDQATGLPGPDGWIWGPVGVLLGVALTLAARRWMTSTGPATDEADIESVDIGPADNEPGQPMVETLSSHAPRPH